MSLKFEFISIFLTYSIVNLLHNNSNKFNKLHNLLNSYYLCIIAKNYESTGIDTYHKIYRFYGGSFIPFFAGKPSWAYWHSPEQQQRICKFVLLYLRISFKFLKWSNNFRQENQQKTILCQQNCPLISQLSISPYTCGSQFFNL